MTIATANPLEDFLRDYVETIGGAWDEVEPQVYDLLIPTAAPATRMEVAEQDIVRVTFDPEALPEHPGAQLASFGTPLLERLLGDAVQRGRYAEMHMLGLNVAPHDLRARVRRGLTLAPTLELRVERVRVLLFPQAIHWFQIAFVSDQKEQEILPVALDLHYGRRVRHLEKLLDFARLGEQPAQRLPEARRSSLAAAYPLAQAEALGMLGALANVRERELRERLSRQIERVSRYYGDLRQELEEQARRSRSSAEAKDRWSARRQAIDNEERLRIAELRQKNTLRIQLHLLCLLVIQQPKLLVRAVLQDAHGASGPLELVWDPLLESLEAAPCTQCHKPSFQFGLSRQRSAICETCSERQDNRRERPDRKERPTQQSA